MKSKKRSLENRVRFVEPIETLKGWALPYCKYPRHRGVIGKMRYRECIEKDCHYLKLYVEQR